MPNFHTLSIVIPLHNEHGNVELLVERLTASLREIQVNSEIILVDDGSRDETWVDIINISETHEDVRGIRLSRNFGHMPALLAGLSQARGHAIISMDGDLQHPPEIIPELIDAWEKGADIVNTKRLDKDVAGFFKRKSSNLFYKFFSSLSNVPLEQGSSDFRLLDREVLNIILKLPSNELFLRGMVEWVGFRSTTIPFKAAKRHSGTTKYNFVKMIAFATRAIVSFSSKPLRVSLWLGVITSLLSFSYMVYAVIVYFHGVTQPGWASTIAVLSFLFGVLFIVLGVIGLYIARIHETLTGRPGFIIAERIGNLSDHTLSRTHPRERLSETTKEI